MVQEASYGGPTVLQSPLFVETILPFLLVFTIVFAVLQKSKILGDGKKQIDAIVSLVVGLIVVSFLKATQIIVTLMPFLAVSLVIIMVFLILWGIFWKEGEFDVGKKVKIAAGIVALIAVIIAVLMITGYWENIMGMFNSGSALLGNIIIIVIIAVAIIVALTSGKSESSGSGK